MTSFGIDDIMSISSHGGNNLKLTQKEKTKMNRGNAQKERMMMKKKLTGMIMTGVLVFSITTSTIAGGVYASEVDTMEAEVVEVTQEAEVAAEETVSVEAGEVTVVEKVVEETVAPETGEETITETLSDVPDESIEAIETIEPENTTADEVEAIETEIAEDVVAEIEENESTNEENVLITGRSYAPYEDGSYTPDFETLTGEFVETYSDNEDDEYYGNIMTNHIFYQDELEPGDMIDLRFDLNGTNYVNFEINMIYINGELVDFGRYVYWDYNSTGNIDNIMTLSIYDLYNADLVTIYGTFIDSDGNMVTEKFNIDIIRENENVGRLEVLALDESGNGINGIIYRVVNDRTGEEFLIETDIDGLATLALPAGYYVVEETINWANENYDFDFGWGDGFFTLTSEFQYALFIIDHTWRTVVPSEPDVEEPETEIETDEEIEDPETETEEPETEEVVEKIFSFVAVYEDYSFIEGIEIIISNAETGSAQKFVTDVNGRVVAYLPCGEYLVYELANGVNNGFTYNVEATFKLTVDGVNAVNMVNIHLLSETENPETESEETDVEETNTDETETDIEDIDETDTDETESDTTEQGTVDADESNNTNKDSNNDESASNDTDTESDAMVTSSESTKTGDQQDILAVTIVLLASIIVVIAIIKAKKYNEKNNW